MKQLTPLLLIGLAVCLCAKPAAADTIFERFVVFYKDSQKPAITDLSGATDWAGKCTEVATPDQFRSAVLHFFRRRDPVLGTWHYAIVNLWRQSETYAQTITASQLRRLRAEAIDNKLPFVSAFSDTGDALVTQYKSSVADNMIYLRKNKANDGSLLWVLRINSNLAGTLQPDPTREASIQTGEAFAYCYFNSSLTPSSQLSGGAK